MSEEGGLNGLNYFICLNWLFNCSVFDNMPIPYPKRKFLWDDDGKDDKDKVFMIISIIIFISSVN